MSDQLIITLGREFGSGGKEVGEKLAERLGIKLYDKELLQQAAKESGFCEEIFENHDEKPTNSFLYSLVMDTYSVNGYSSAPFLDMPLNHKVFLAQFDTIKKIAANESCVIVGRCADYVLKENPNVVSVFIHADKKFCLERALERNSMTEKEMQKYIEKTDRFRGDFYRYHTGNEWADARNYDLCLNSGKLGFQKCVEEIKSYIKIRFNDEN